MGDGIRVTIPSPRNWLVIIFLGAWCGGWFFGEVTVGGQILNPSPKDPIAFLSFWLIAWTAGGILAFGALLWQLAGREVLAVNSAGFSQRIEAFGIGRTRNFDASQIRRLRATEGFNSMFMNQRTWFPAVVGTGYGTLAFDYGPRTFRFAPALDTAEAEMVAKELRPWLPRYSEAT
jgi:hypothetical protein